MREIPSMSLCIRFIANRALTICLLTVLLLPLSLSAKDGPVIQAIDGAIGEGFSMVDGHPARVVETFEPAVGNEVPMVVEVVETIDGQEWVRVAVDTSRMPPIGKSGSELAEVIDYEIDTDRGTYLATRTVDLDPRGSGRATEVLGEDELPPVFKVGPLEGNSELCYRGDARHTTTRAGVTQTEVRGIIRWIYDLDSSCIQVLNPQLASCNPVNSSDWDDLVCGASLIGTTQTATTFEARGLFQEQLPPNPAAPGGFMDQTLTMSIAGPNMSFVGTFLETASGTYQGQAIGLRLFDPSCTP